MASTGSEISYIHNFQVNGEPLVVQITRGQNVVERVLEEFLCWNIMGLISDEQFIAVRECFSERSFNATALLKVPGISAHNRG